MRTGSIPIPTESVSCASCCCAQAIQLLLSANGRTVSRATVVRIGPATVYDATAAARTVSSMSRGIGGETVTHAYVYTMRCSVARGVLTIHICVVLRDAGGRPSYVVLFADAPYIAAIMNISLTTWPTSDTRYAPVIYAVTSYTHGYHLAELLVASGSPAFIQSQPQTRTYA